MRGALLVLAAACSRSHHEPQATAPPSNGPITPGGVSINPSDLRGVTLDCTDFAPKVMCAPRLDPAPAATALLEVAARLPEYLALHRPPDDRWTVLRAGIDGAAELDPHVLSTEARIAVQNAALRIAVYADHSGGQTALVAAALGVADHLALPPSTLSGLGDVPSDGLAKWIGTPETWQLRDTRDMHDGELPPALHDQTIGMGFELFEPVVVSDGRQALFAQLITVDTDGAPHVTPVIGQIEARASGAIDAPACVAELSLGPLACGVPAGLQPVDPVHHPKTHFFQVVDGLAQCNSCHTVRDLPLVPAADAPRVLADARRAALTDARAALQHARAAK